MTSWNNMMMDATAVIPHVHAAVVVTGRCRDLIAALLQDEAASNAPLKGHVSHLAAFFSDRTTGILTLVQQGLLWDAEILMRCAAEAALKLAVVCFAPSGDRVRLLEEYWQGLGAAGELRRSEHARLMLEGLAPDSPDRPMFQDLLLAEADQAAIRSRWPKEVRRDMERRWSFTEMLTFLDKNLPGPRELSHHMLRHGYGIGSHLTHADCAGVGLPIDRDERAPEVRTAMVNAHAARLVGDCVAYWIMIAAATSNAFAADRGKLSEVLACWAEFTPLLEPFDCAFEAALMRESAAGAGG